MIRIFLADDHEVVRRGLRTTLERRGIWEICGEATTGREAVAMAIHLKPDIVVLDVFMPELNGLEAAYQIHKQVPGTEILMFSAHESDQLVCEAFDAGARGYVLKKDAVRQLTTAIEELIHHRPFFPGRAAIALDTCRTGATGAKARQTPRRLLTPREREVVQLIAEANNNRQIADLLLISVKTVETHRARIMHKLSITSLPRLILWAMRNGFIEPMYGGSIEL